MSVRVAAAVLASRGGPRLERALASVAWADERVVLDPAGRLSDAPLPAGVRRARQVDEAGGPAWLLLLEEHEAVPPALAARIAATVQAAPADAAFRIGMEVQAFGATFRPPGAPVRLVRGPADGIRLGPGLVTALRAGERAMPRLPERLVVRAADSLAEAVEDIDADAAMLAALLARRRLRPRAWHLVLPPLAAAGRLLAAGGAWRSLRRRWIVAVLHGYRAALAYGKLWEMRQAEVAALR